jgi:hypothetical protein
MRRSIPSRSRSFTGIYALAQTGTNSSCSTAIVLPVAPSNLQT